MPGPQDYRSLELEAAAATAVARGSTAVGKFFKYGVPLGAVAIGAWMIYTSLGRAPKNMTAPDKEEFTTTTQFPAPSLATQRPRTDQGTIILPQASGRARGQAAVTAGCPAPSLAGATIVRASTYDVAAE